MVIETKQAEIITDEPEIIEANDETIVNDNDNITAPAVVEQSKPQPLPDYEILNPEINIAEKLETTMNVANTVRKIVEQQKLVKTGLNKQNPEEKYVLKGGWEMLNTFMGLTTVTRVIDEIRNNKDRIIGYKASCTLLKDPVYENGEIKGGKPMAYAEASATKEGFQKETSSMMSMAQTRAYNKATRNCMGWIMQMAGFQGTPAEEMPTYRENKE